MASGVAAHLGIAIGEYDARIRTFIPDYEEMIAVAGAAVPIGARTIVDLGVGTGALAARCLAHARRATIVGIDADAAMIPLARRRLGSRGRLIAGDFLRADLPRCDAVVASFALHHVRTRAAKAALYRRVQRALRRGGVVVTVDCHPSADRRMAARQHAAWRAHLRRSYSPARADGFLDAWSREDVYVSLDAERLMIEACGLRPDVIWRKGAFAVVVAGRSSRR
ncbi:MAG TPA: class I SAM-dependent methyltransferase [Vicinamibacterales bacterium]|nr:class I SAM-dependent methyltransferase [Vicinamibacterales bacterium]